MSALRFLLFVVTLPLFAQVDHGSLNGTVTDASGAVVAGVKVEAASAATGFRTRATTGTAGTYQIPVLPVGVYSVAISKSGFRTVEYKDIEITIGQRTIDARLAVGALTE